MARISKAFVGITIAAFIAGGLSAMGTQRLLATSTTCGESYDLLNPLVLCRIALLKSAWEFEPLRTKMLEYIKEAKTAGKVENVSVFFRSKGSGPRFGIGEYEAFYPASLLKVPVMIGILHAADRAPEILDEKYSYMGEIDVDSNIEIPDETIEPNTPYTVQELLEKMIKYSDNFSMSLLVDKLTSLPPALVYNTFLDNGISKIMTDEKEEYVSIQSYANLFAVLYNAGYLSRPMSQYALELLTRSTYNDGLVAGVPVGTRVAHKFGFRVVPKTGENQLHDCGIVYHPAMHYTLCVMTSGKDPKALASVLADISRITYETVGELDAKTLLE